MTQLPTFRDLTGEQFNRLRVIGQAEKSRCGRTRWKCRCTCGKEVIVQGAHLVSGHTQSCGCYNKDRIKETFVTHGGTGTRLFRIWSSMKTRCYNQKSKTYGYYGGRGITVCDEWLHDFEAFRAWALSNGYHNELTLDRIDCDEGYSPSNCRWATWHEQRINQRRCDCQDKKEAAPVLEHRDGQAKQKVSETDCFALSLPKDERECQE